jgi:hypothetical protein
LKYFVILYVKLKLAKTPQLISLFTEQEVFLANDANIFNKAIILIVTTKTKLFQKKLREKDTDIFFFTSLKVFYCSLG